MTSLTFARRRTFHRKSPCGHCSWWRRKLTCFESCRMNPVCCWIWRSVFCQIRLRSCWRDWDSWRINGQLGLSARNAIRCAPIGKELGAALYSWQSQHPSDQSALSRSGWLNAGSRSEMAAWRGHLTPCPSCEDPCFSCRLKLRLCCSWGCLGSCFHWHGWLTSGVDSSRRFDVNDERVSPKYKK